MPHAQATADLHLESDHAAETRLTTPPLSRYRNGAEKYGIDTFWISIQQPVGISQHHVTALQPANDR